jgi:hypothetical protein
MQPIKYKVAIDLARKVRKRYKKWEDNPKGRKPPRKRIFTVRTSYRIPHRKVLVVDFTNYKRLKVRHQFIASKDFKRHILNELTIYANVDDITLKRAPKTSLEGFANSLILTSERIEKAAIRANPPVFDKSYVERADYPLTSLYSDYKDIIESSTLAFYARIAVFGAVAWPTINEVTTWADYRQERLKWRKCRNKFCLNYFPTHVDNFKKARAKRSDAVFCCQACQEANRDSQKRFEKTGSYLPSEFYLPCQSQSVSDAARKNESAYTLDKICKQQTKNRPLRNIPARPKSTMGQMQVFSSLADAKAAYKPAAGSKIIA